MSKFKVGDKVVSRNYMNGEDCYGTAMRVGELGVYAEDWTVGQRDGWLSDYQLEPVYTSCAAAEVDNLADEYGRGKRFKVGDRVRDTVDGDYATVNGVHADGISVTWDDGCEGDSHWPFCAARQVLVWLPPRMQ